MLMYFVIGQRKYALEVNSLALQAKPVLLRIVATFLGSGRALGCEKSSLYIADWYMSYTFGRKGIQMFSLHVFAMPGRACPASDR